MNAIFPHICLRQVNHFKHLKKDPEYLLTTFDRWYRWPFFIYIQEWLSWSPPSIINYAIEVSLIVRSHTQSINIHYPSFLKVRKVSDYLYSTMYLYMWCWNHPKLKRETLFILTFEIETDLIFFVTFLSQNII